MNDHAPIHAVIAGIASGTAGQTEARSLLLALGRMAAGGRPLPAVPAAVLPALVEAGRDLAAQLAAENPRLASLGDRWHDAPGQIEADVVASGPLALRLDALYALEGVEAVAETAHDGGLEDTAETLAAAIVAFDSALRGQLDCLATLADGEVLADWRRSLPDDMDPVPWWLDGTLEAHAAALARQTDALSSRLADAFAGQTASQPPVAASAAAARAIVAAAGLAMAAATPATAGITRHAWRHPSRSLEGVLWVPAAFDDSAELRIVFRDSGGGASERDLVGEVMFFEGMPGVVRCSARSDGDLVEVAWPAQAVAGVVRDSVSLADARGVYWIPEG